MTDSAPAAAPQTVETPPASTPDPTAAPPTTSAETPPPAQPEKGGTILDAPESDDSGAEVDGWGQDWRQKYAGEDEKLLKRLERYASPKAALDALLEAQKKISAGDFKKGLPENATEEQVAAWRKENGLPEKPEQYFDKLPDGLVLGEEDRELFNDFASKMHGLNVEPKVMHEVVRWYNDFVEDRMASQSEFDRTSREATEDTLRSEWGADYRANLNMINSWLGSAGDDIKGALLNARTPDGRPLVNDPALMRWFAQQVREINPAATLVPGTLSNSTQGVEDEISSIEKTMRENRTAYMRDEKMQARYRQLIDARQKLAKAS